jgi:hypothetical protein
MTDFYNGVGLARFRGGFAKAQLSHTPFFHYRRLASFMRYFVLLLPSLSKVFESSGCSGTFGMKLCPPCNVSAEPYQG